MEKDENISNVEKENFPSICLCFPPQSPNPLLPILWSRNFQFLQCFPSGSLIQFLCYRLYGVRSRCGHQRQESGMKFACIWEQWNFSDEVWNYCVNLCKTTKKATTKVSEFPYSLSSGWAEIYPIKIQWNSLTFWYSLVSLLSSLRRKAIN